MPADPLGEARARLDRVFQHVLGDERAAALLHAHQPAARQFLERAPHRVAIDAELLRQLRLGRQAAARRISAGADVVLQPVAICRHSATPSWRSTGSGDVIANVIHADASFVQLLA